LNWVETNIIEKYSKITQEFDHKLAVYDYFEATKEKAYNFVVILKTFSEAGEDEAKYFKY
jgi:hypothetical protein